MVFQTLFHDQNRGERPAAAPHEARLQLLRTLNRVEPCADHLLCAAMVISISMAIY